MGRAGYKKRYMMDIARSLESLNEIIAGYRSLCVAFSGGNDSLLLAACARNVLGENMCAVTVISEFSIRREAARARRAAARAGFIHHELPAELLDIEEIVRNDRQRCYHCKKSIFSGVIEFARGRGIAAVADGTNLDDQGDFRPGIQALRELGIVSPLAEAGFTKKMILDACSFIGIEVESPSSNSCLAARIAWGQRIEARLLDSIDRAEARLGALGFDPVRVRVHGQLARIEVSEEGIMRLAGDGALRKEALDAVRESGFTLVTLDLEPFRSGSMNRLRHDIL